MNCPEWGDEMDCAVTVCDINGIIVYMNNKAISQFAGDGGEALIGKSLYGCHPKEAGDKIRQLIEEKKSNTYTIEKKGLKKLIRQEPWYKGGVISGLVEFSFVLPSDMPHFIRG